MATNPDNGRKLSQEEVEILSDMGLLEYVNLETESVTEGPILNIQVYRDVDCCELLYDHDCELHEEVSTIHQFIEKMMGAYKAMGFETPLQINLCNTIFEGEPIYFDPMK